MTQRILHILSQRPSHTGSGTTLVHLVRQADRHDWKQFAVVGTPQEDESPTVAGLDRSCVFPLVFGAEKLNFSLPGMSDVMPYASSRFSQLSTEQLAAYSEAWRGHLTRVIKTVRPDVIHSHHIWLLSSLVKDVAPNIPVVTHCHGTGLRQMQLCPHLCEQVIAGCRRNDRFFALHKRQADEIASTLRVDRNRVVVVGAGFDENVFHERQHLPLQTTSLCYAGKLSFAKGLPQLLDAVDMLRNTCKSLTLHIAGSGTGTEAELLKSRMQQLHPHVQWHGQLSPTELAELFRSCQVFVLPSFFEGLPLVVVEAVACGCRVVATDLPGIRELNEALSNAMQLVAPPRLTEADRPVPGDVPPFVLQLSDAIKNQLSSGSLSDVARLIEPLTWQLVFQRVEHQWRDVNTSV